MQDNLPDAVEPLDTARGKRKRKKIDGPSQSRAGRAEARHKAGGLACNSFGGAGQEEEAEGPVDVFCLPPSRAMYSWFCIVYEEKKLASILGKGARMTGWMDARFHSKLRSIRHP